MLLNNKFPIQKITSTIAFVFTSSFLFAHNSIIDLEKMSKADTTLLYLKTGFEHILPAGLDHILFIISLFLLTPKLKPLLLQATAFTIAHTITLAASMYKVINISSSIIEPLIAISIMYVALENIFTQKLGKARIGIVFLFGLIHGMGFAGALSEMGLPQNSFLLSLLMFNVGVELGQITIIILAYFILAKWFANKTYYRKWVIMPLSIAIAIVALYWTVERLFF